MIMMSLSVVFEKFVINTRLILFDMYLFVVVSFYIFISILVLAFDSKLVATCPVKF